MNDTILAPRAGGEPEHRHLESFSFSGGDGEYFGIWIVNILLPIVTFGINSAWAKATRRYVYGNTRLTGHSSTVTPAGYRFSSGGSSLSWRSSYTVSCRAYCS